VYEVKREDTVIKSEIRVYGGDVGGNVLDMARMVIVVETVI
jgi:hypothetical protein